MTVKDFQKSVLDRYSSSTEQPELTKLMRQLCGHPFYCNSCSGNNCNYKGKGDCTWHSFAPLTTKDEPSDLYPFQREVISDLETYKRISILKCRNAGISQIALMYGIHLTLSRQIPGNYIFITGVGYHLSKSLALRVRAMFKTKDIFFDDNITTLTFPNNIRWSFYPIDSKSYRGQSDIVYLRRFRKLEGYYRHFHN